MSEPTVVRVGTDPNGRPILMTGCFDCRQPTEKSRCPKCAKNHRARAARRKKKNGYKNPRAGFGHALGRAYRTGQDILPVVHDWMGERDSECWPWPGTLNRAGYGQFRSTEVKGLGHRLTYEAATGTPLAPGAVVHHKCANRACVNPDHLQAVTPQENTAEMFERNALLRRIAALEAIIAKAGLSHG